MTDTHQPMASPMTKAHAETAGPLALLRQIFGLQPGQKLSEFVAETKTVKEDAAFTEECRAYAVAHATE